MKKNYFAIAIATMLVSIMSVACGKSEDVQVEEVQVEEVQVEAQVMSDSRFPLNTTDIDGNAVTIDDFADAKLIMVNFWEPWCGPCVREMPDLEKLYEEYSQDGFVIVGIFDSYDMTDEVREVIEACGTTYPILNYTESMEPFTTDYVPTTIFIDNMGNVLTSEPIIVAKDYVSWKGMIEAYLN